MRIKNVLVALLALPLTGLASTSAGVDPSAAPGEFYGAMQTEYPEWFKKSFLDFEEDIAEAKAAGKRVMVLFYQDGCPYCHVLVDRNLAQKDIERKVRAHFDVIAINIWGDRELTLGGQQYTEKTFSAALKVQFTPTLLFFDEAGKIVLRLNGYLPPRKFDVALDYVAGRHEQQTTYRDYVAANARPAAGASLHDEDFFIPPPYDLRRKPGSAARPLAVFFEQKDCPSCDTLHTRVLPDRETREIIEQFDNVQLDMWAQTRIVTPAGEQTTAREWAKALNIQYAPAIVLFDDQGEEIIRAEASFKVFHVQGLFAYVLSGAYRAEPSFQRYLSDRADDLVEQGREIDIWRYADEAPSPH
jgi:thioredoxin-related protein